MNVHAYSLILLMWTNSKISHRNNAYLLLYILFNPGLSSQLPHGDFLNMLIQG